MTARSKVKTTTRLTRTQRTPVADVKRVTRRTQSRGGETPKPAEIRQVEAAVAQAMSGFCATEFARTQKRRTRGVRVETRQQAEKFETMVARWVRAEQRSIVETANRRLGKDGCGFEVSRIVKATSKSFDLEIRFRRCGERGLLRLPANVKVNSNQRGLSLVAGELALVGYGCTGIAAHAVEDAWSAWGDGARGTGYLVLAFVGSKTARASQVVYYNPVLMDPAGWEWNLRYPQVQADHLQAAAAYEHQRLPATFDDAGSRFLGTLADRMEARLEQRRREIRSHRKLAGLASTPNTSSSAARGRTAKKSSASPGRKPAPARKPAGASARTIAPARATKTASARRTR